MDRSRSRALPFIASSWVNRMNWGREAAGRPPGGEAAGAGAGAAARAGEPPAQGGQAGCLSEFALPKLRARSAAASRQLACEECKRRREGQHSRQRRLHGSLPTPGGSGGARQRQRCVERASQSAQAERAVCHRPDAQGGSCRERRAAMTAAADGGSCRAGLCAPVTCMTSRNVWAAAQRGQAPQHGACKSTHLLPARGTAASRPGSAGYAPAADRALASCKQTGSSQASTTSHPQQARRSARRGMLGPRPACHALQACLGRALAPAFVALYVPVDARCNSTPIIHPNGGRRGRPCAAACTCCRRHRWRASFKCRWSGTTCLAAPSNQTGIHMLAATEWAASPRFGALACHAVAATLLGLPPPAATLGLWACMRCVSDPSLFRNLL